MNDKDLGKGLRELVQSHKNIDWEALNALLQNTTALNFFGGCLAEAGKMPPRTAEWRRFSVKVEDYDGETVDDETVGTLKPTSRIWQLVDYFRRFSFRADAGIEVSVVIGLARDWSIESIALRLTAGT
jgi:hypothetical protein